MRSYRVTSHSLAVTVPRPRGVEELEDPFGHRHSRDNSVSDWFADVGESMVVNPLPDQPWWWIIAVHGAEAKAPGQDGIPWDQLVEKFQYQMTEADKTALVGALSSGSGRGAGFGIDDPKLQTVKLDGSGKVLFRALPQGRCDHRTHPPRASFLPRVLPPVPDGECVLELCGLEPDTDYRLMLFNVSNATSPPKVAPPPFAKIDGRTVHPPWRASVMKQAMLALCILAMAVAVAWRLAEDCLSLKKPTNYSQVGLFGNDEEGGFHQVTVRNMFISILRDMLVCMTMFLPVLGPIGLVLASDIVIGSRIGMVKRSREAYSEAADEHKTGKLLELVRDAWNVLINIIMIPFNMYMVQTLWMTYCHKWYRYFGMGPFQDTSYGGLQQSGSQWLLVSGVELNGWVPGICLSQLLLAIELRNYRTSEMLQKHRKRAEAHLNGLAKGRELWTKLCKMDGGLFERALEIPDPLARRVLRLCLAVLFSLLPHLWMCLRHGVPLWSSPMLWVTVVYVVNISGVSARFLVLYDRICNLYTTNCEELATFQALSWHEDLSTAIYDPFATRNKSVVAARKRLRENIPRIACLKLADPEDSKVWWHLREHILIQIKDGRILMEMTVFVGICFSLLVGVFSLAVMTSLREITAITVVAAPVMVVLLRFTYRALSFARDINLMCAEHTSLLHNIVAEMNMPLRPQAPLERHLSQERFLLQVATLIEKQPPPETVASFAVTPQLFSLVVGTVGLLTAVSLCVLVTGVIGMSS